MVNILLTGVGGQGTVLAAKVLAMAAAAKGWQVRTAETIGMAQRGGSVVSHVRMGNLGESVHAPLVTHGTANLIVAFEPGEAARCLGYLAPGGTVVTATTAVEPVAAALTSKPYRSQDIIENIKLTFYNDVANRIANSVTATREGQRRASQHHRLVVVDDMAVTSALGDNRKVLNSILLGAAVAKYCMPISLDDLKGAVLACVKPQFAQMNIDAINKVAEGIDYYANEA
ncbi:2-oxoacid:acceptor oxidoreductase family protein [Adlercreutzia sp. ZJ154]|uniref:2-oxoacid:acceptor oxidoreductase family protein n=1 Tax=Adlercreutzia sp. ZJ154 TaxID=2709790 RepID=UPI0013ED7653|nr:2-oxoacid:acceptor oxidoreductase family protein [Adlercreutzia sp. ZJ154]